MKMEWNTAEMEIRGHFELPKCVLFEASESLD